MKSGLRRVRRDPRLLAIEAIRRLTAPLVRLQNHLRRRRRLARGGRFIAPLTVPSLSPNGAEGPHVVFYGPSYGEFLMMERVARTLQAARPDLVISYFLRDAGAVADLRAAKPALRIGVWPEETLDRISLWLEDETPDLAVFAERFRYPLFVGALKAYGAKVALMNGRCRTRKGLKYALLAPFYRWQFAGFSVLAMQREDYYRAALESAPSDVKVILSGDIKLDLAAPEPNASLTAWLPSDLPLLVAGSTETAEEERMVLAAFKQLTGCRLLIAPRQPRVIEGLLANLADAGLASSRRSENGPAAPVMILDTMGELTAAYAHGVAAYVGGSFTEGGGGHNLMEPLLAGLPVAYGMRRGHFEVLQKLAEAEGVGTRISSADELATFWRRMIENPGERAEIGAKGQALLERSRGAIARTVEALLAELPPTASVREAL